MKITLNGLFFFVFSLIYFSGANINLLAMDADYESQTDDDVEPLDAAKLQSIEIDDWLTRPFGTDDLLLICDEFIKQTFEKYSTAEWLNKKTPMSELAELIEWQNFDTAHPKIACLSKLIIPEETPVEIFGDIHGEIDTIECFLLDLEKRGIVNQQMKIQNNAHIIFLGDLMDRGDNGLRVLVTVLILAIKNPSHVHLIRGNHENYRTNLNFSTLDEIKEIEESPEKQRQIAIKLIKIYECMQTAILLGCTRQTQTEFQFLVHGGPDIRYDYSDFLEFHAQDHSQQGGICFWNIKESDILGSPKIKSIFESLQEAVKIDIETKNVLDDYIHSSPIYGFVFNDFAIQNESVKRGSRGGLAISLNPDYIKYFFDLFSNEKARIVGVIRGHQHMIPKQISRMPILFPSSGCGYFGSPTKAEILLENNVTKYLIIFTVITLISGPIYYPDNGTINYSPTYLEIKKIPACTWQAKAITIKQ